MLRISYFHFYITKMSEFEQKKKKAKKSQKSPQRNEKYQLMNWNVANIPRYKITDLRQLGFVLPYCLTLPPCLC